MSSFSSTAHPGGQWPPSVCSFSAGTPGPSATSSWCQLPCHGRFIFAAEDTGPSHNERMAEFLSQLGSVLTSDSFYRTQAACLFTGSCKAGFNTRQREHAKALACSAACFFQQLCKRADRRLTLPPDTATRGWDLFCHH